MQDAFGFFVDDFALIVGPYSIEPIHNHAAVVDKVLKLKQSDGFLYPPVSEPPKYFFPLPTTHTVRMQAGGCLPADFREKDGAFLIRLLAVMHGARAQFHDWQYDIRFPLKQTPLAVFTNGELAIFIEEIYTVFSLWNYENQRRYCNILYLHSRCPAYIVEWDQFAMEYMVTDALWKLFSILQSVTRRVPHKERIKEMCNALAMYYDADEVEHRIVEFRNKLIHEGFWGESTPGFPTQNFMPLHASLNLEKINQRLILAITGFRSVFTNSDWRSFDPCALY